jgi:hypothetical protein
MVRHALSVANQRPLQAAGTVVHIHSQVVRTEIQNEKRVPDGDG